MIFIPTDAHEGCTYVPTQQRLYFSTTKKLDEPRVAIHYLDFSPFDFSRDANWASRFKQDDADRLQAIQWIYDANMANSLTLSRDGEALLVAEQGDLNQPSQLTRITLEGKQRGVLFDNYRGQELNSLNKVIVSERGHIIVSDPDYGFRQGFRPPPALEPSLYVLPKDGDPFAFDCGLQMPHGLALSPDERTLYVTDTSFDGAHEDEGIELSHRRRSVYAYDFDPATGRITDNPRFCFLVEEGVPDGSVTDHESLLVGGGDGVYVSDLTGNLWGKIPLDRTAVNLDVVHGHLFVTADEGVYLILDWRDEVRAR